MTTNFIIATYNRINKEHIKFNKLKSVIENLLSFKNNLTQITVVISEISETNFIDRGYMEYLNNLNNEYSFIKIIKKPNDTFVSYSAYYEAWKTFPNFDYYFFCEDDYFFCQDNFDQIMIDTLYKNSVDYYFAYMRQVPVFGLHATHGIGFCKGSILTDIFNNFYDRMYETKFPHQVAFTKLFLDFPQYKYCDSRNTEYKTPFFSTGTKKTYTICNNRLIDNTIVKNSILMPVQYYIYSKCSFPCGKPYNYYNT